MAPINYQLNNAQAIARQAIAARPVAQTQNTVTFAKANAQEASPEAPAPKHTSFLGYLAKLFTSIWNFIVPAAFRSNKQLVNFDYSKVVSPSGLSVLA